MRGVRSAGAAAAPDARYEEYIQCGTQWGTRRRLARRQIGAVDARGPSAGRDEANAIGGFRGRRAS